MVICLEIMFKYIYVPFLKIVKPVKWEQVLHMIYGRKQGTDFPRTFECGPGRGLNQILSKVNAKAHNSAFNVEA